MHKSYLFTAYEILSDEEKRKNYDLYGDEMGKPRFDAGPGDHGGYTHFTSGNQGNSRFTFRPDEFHRMGRQGNSESFSFSFGGNPSESGSSFGFGMDDIFSNFFGGATKGWNPFGSSSESRSGSRSSPHRIPAINYKVFKNDITDKGIAWLLLSSSPTSKGYHVLESVAEEVSRSLEGALKVPDCAFVSDCVFLCLSFKRWLFFCYINYYVMSF